VVCRQVCRVMRSSPAAVVRRRTAPRRGWREEQRRRKFAFKMIASVVQSLRGSARCRARKSGEQRQFARSVLRSSRLRKRMANRAMLSWRACDAERRIICIPDAK